MTTPPPSSVPAEVGATTLPVMTERDVARLLSTELLLSTVERTLLQMAQGRVVSGEKTVIELDDADGRRTFLAMPGVLLDEGMAGVKWVATVARNREAGLPRAPATILLSDAVTALPLAVVEATGMTARRTAAMAAVAAKYCAPRKAARVAILGLGAIGSAVIPLLAALFPLRRVTAWGGDPGRLLEKAEVLSVKLGIPIVPAASVAEAVAGAEIIVTASGLAENRPFLHRAMLRDNAFVCALGSYQEIAEDIITAAGMLVVDDWKACTKRGNLAVSIRAGRITRASISGELPGLVEGRLPRRDPSKLALACFLGIGALDVALAARVFGLGRAG